MSNANRWTRQEYDAQSPRVQGYVSYMQSDWNMAVPSKCPYGKHTPQAKAWLEGQFAAMIDAQDGEE